MKNLLCSVLGLLLTFSLMATEADFPVEGPMRVRVDFWKRVYTEIISREAFLHDMDDLSLVYRKIFIPHTHHRKKAKYAKMKKREVAKLLRAIAKKRGEGLNDEEREVYEVVKHKSFQEIRNLAHRVRYQYGLRDNYYKGLIRSYEYQDAIREIFAEMKLPEELTYLPHVESSFNYHAYSRVGAAGIWQFMRSTARLYRLKMDYIIDERRDPMKATKAAAQLLRDNYRRLQSWPLALTAYNHGPRRIERAMKKFKTKDINIIIEEFSGRRFGFASKNFYATFMATVEISKDPGRYFDKFTKPEPLKYSLLKLDRPYTMKHLLSVLKVPMAEMKHLNPAIRSMAYRSSLFFPRGFELKIPPTSDEKLAVIQSTLTNLKLSNKNLRTAGIHKVRRGENLYFISKAYQIGLEDLIQYNNIAHPSRIYVGMKLKIPTEGELKLTKTQSTPTPSKPVEAKKVVVAQVESKDKQMMETSPLDVEKEKKKKGFISKVLGFFSSRSDDQDDVQAEKSEKILPPIKKTEKNISLESYHLDLNKIQNGLYQVTIEPDETLGHYSDWGLVYLKDLVKANGLSHTRDIRMGQKLKIPLNEKNISRFETKRMEYHISQQEDFYEDFKTEGFKDYTVRRGDNLTKILNVHSLPLWLFRKHQGKTFDVNLPLSAGQVLKIPQVVALHEEPQVLDEPDNDEGVQ